MISQGVMLRGASLASLWLPFLMLTVMAVVVFSGATLRFRRDLAPGRRRHRTAGLAPVAGRATGPAGTKAGSGS
jgi:ABC-2 type transport system permease protein